MCAATGRARSSKYAWRVSQPGAIASQTAWLACLNWVASMREERSVRSSLRVGAQSKHDDSVADERLRGRGV